MTSYLTELELDMLQLSDLSRDSPYIIQGVSNGFFSVARHYGGCTAYDSRYVYHSPTDELIRADVIEWTRKFRRSVEKARKQVAKDKQGELL